MHKFTVSFFFLFLSEVLYSASAYFIVVGLSRMLGPADYGRYALVLGLVTMITVLVARSVPTAMMKRISEKPDDLHHVAGVRRAAIRLQVPLIIAATLLYLILAPIIAKILGDTTLTPLIQLSALIIPLFSLSSFYVLFLNGLKSFKTLAVIKALRGITRIALILVCAYYFALEGSLIGNALAPLILFIIATIIAHMSDKRMRDIRTLKNIPIYPTKKILGYAGGFVLFLLCYELFIRLDLYFIKALTGSDVQTGIYDAATKIALIPYFGAYALTLMLFPTLSEMVEKGDTKAIRKLLRQLGKIFGILLPLGAITIYIFRDLAVSILFGEKFADAATLIPYMLGATICGTTFYILASVLNGAGKAKTTATIVFIGLAVSTALNLTFLPTHGYHATAFIFSLTTTIMALLAIIITHKTFFTVEKPLK